uniref:Fucosyltransferase N-terminal domain-containing protein n=1 Tax=Loxodonta africana TaxID=9785 RepID=G3TV96_LOXAF
PSTPHPPGCNSCRDVHLSHPSPQLPAPGWEKAAKFLPERPKGCPWAHLGVTASPPSSLLQVLARWRLRAWWSLAGGALLLALWLLWPPRLVPGETLEPQPTLTILVWHWPFADEPPDLPSDTCTRFGATHCRLSANRSLLASADAVVFHHRELQAHRVRLPLDRRPQGQPWVWASMESPSHTHGLRRLHGIFNWVLSYRQDSDIFVPYGNLESRIPSTMPLKTKMEMTTWMDSNSKKRHTGSLVPVAEPFTEKRMYGRAYRSSPSGADCRWPAVGPVTNPYASKEVEIRVKSDQITQREKFLSFYSGYRHRKSANFLPRSKSEAFAASDTLQIKKFGSARELTAFLAGMNKTRYQRFSSRGGQLRVRLVGDWQERFCAICARYPHLPRGQVYEDLEGWFQA